MYKKLREDIKDCDMLLIGIGHEVSLFQDINIKENISRESWNENIAKCEDVECEKIISFYNILEGIISDKNYFILSTNVDGLIYKSKINPIRIVTPCGNIDKLQCSCTDKIIDAPKNFYKDNVELICNECGCQFVSNVFNKNNYNENGYLKQWNLYNKWLQGTLNKKLVVIELGCELSWMSIVRMPFEKIVLINQKSIYYRVNGRFPQITAELNGRMFSIQDVAFEFAKKLNEV